MGQNGSLSQIKNCSMPCGAKLREDMQFGLLVREAKINKNTRHGIICTDGILWRDG